MHRALLPIYIAFAVTIPVVALRIGGLHPEPMVVALLAGIAIVGGAFLLAWGSELAAMDIPHALALAFLALVGVLPEYTVDLYFAWLAPRDPSYHAYLTAPMTGANRLLIGFGWPLIVVLYWYKTRKRELVLEPVRSIELVYLTLATVYSFVIPLKGTISLLDTVVLVGIFVAYLMRVLRTGVTEADIEEGPAAVIAGFRPALRRGAAIAMFLYAAAVILLAAEPFAESLIATGIQFGIDEFILVQWLAPLASEAPEASIACVLTLRGDAQAGMGAMVSSKINQWTLLIGTMAIAYSASSGEAASIVLNSRQQGEIFLTAAQSLFGVAVLANLRLSLGEAAAMFLLFAAQLAFPIEWVRDLFAWLYLALGVILIAVNRRSMLTFMRSGLFRGSPAGQVSEL